MRKLVFLFVFLFLLMAKPVSAQVNYEDVVEKIHFTDPERLEARKEIGSSDPVLRVYIYGDLNGPFTKKFFNESFDILKNMYDQKVLFIYKHSPFLNQDKSILAGTIGECVAAQNQFWVNIHPIMDNLGDLENFNSYLQNIDKNKLNQCLTDPLAKGLVKASGSDARLFGFNGNPIIIVQNVSEPQAYSIKVNGAQDISIFKRAFLEAEQGDLNKKDLEDLKSKVSELQQDVEEIGAKQSRLTQELEKLKNLVMSILDRIKNLFN